jgi:dGTPase
VPPLFWNDAQRKARRLGATADDQRSPFQRDRDRILYSSAFRRLAGITQIVRASEADVFHTRQQHTLKVAQVGRRLAEACLSAQAEAAKALGIDAEVVEAACLAHDLGHPPFGHIGEKALHAKVLQYGDTDGYEGNAQSFRILTKLAVRFETEPGLDLTRATLAAVLKYPWMRDTTRNDRDKKWSVYQTEQADFDFAREQFPHSAKSAEAELMDWADDIAYSVHDLEDFHRCNAVPWSRIFSDEGIERLVRGADAKWFAKPTDSMGRLRAAGRKLKGFLFAAFEDLLIEPYEGSKRQRQQLRTMTSALIGRYIKAITLKDIATIGDDGTCVTFEDGAVDEIKILKQITHDYIINSPMLAAQQKGQQRIITQLFDDLCQDSGDTFPRYLPRRLIYLWDAPQQKARFAADCIASLTEAEAIALHARLNGLASGSVLDPIVR